MKISEIIIIVLLIYNLITFLLMGIDKFLAIKGKSISGMLGINRNKIKKDS